jgi:dienelactone hydrolase
MTIHYRLCWLVISALVAMIVSTGTAADHLPGTEPLEGQHDIASQLVDGVDRFLLRKLDESVNSRPSKWQRDFTSADHYVQSVAPNRQRLAVILGLRDPRSDAESFELVSTTIAPAEVARGNNFRILRIRWKAFGDVAGDGYLLDPDTPPKANVIAIPDADQSPESVLGLLDAPGSPVPAKSYMRRLAASGCRVIVPRLVSRTVRPRRNVELTDREFLYRSAFELGRHLIGYELQKILSAADRLENAATSQVPLGIIGWGEGGLLALYAGAVDTRFDAVSVSGYFRNRTGIWREPIDRNIFGLLDQFGDAEIASLIAPRGLLVEPCRGPELALYTRGGAPGILDSTSGDEVRREVDRAEALVQPLGWKIDWIEAEPSTGPAPSDATVSRFLHRILGAPAQPESDESITLTPGVTGNADALQEPLIHEIDRHNQHLLEISPGGRIAFWQQLDTTSLTTFNATVAQYRTYFRDQVIGSFPDALLPPAPRTRKLYDQPKWVGYEVVLDVFPDVIAYGILLLPKDIGPGERRPVIVCQHGLEGRPTDTIVGDHPAYHDFAAKLAERGFVTFAPQNLYLFQDRFRTLQRKANPLGKTLFSIMVPQHRQITEWLATLPQVDPQRIAFYGLSYGGKSAMRIPPLVERYCLSICSADFNDWVWKNASTYSPYSYVWTGEYEIFEFDLGGTFNYSEMAALIAPRPFMVERGHFDGVAPDERVAYEFAKVRHLYQAKLGIGDRCEIEWFVGPHTINGKGTFSFLHRHLNWPEPVAAQAPR